MLFDGRVMIKCMLSSTGEQNEQVVVHTTTLTHIEILLHIVNNLKCMLCFVLVKFACHGKEVTCPVRVFAYSHDM